MCYEEGHQQQTISLDVLYKNKQKKRATENLMCYEEGHQQQHISLELFHQKKKRKEPQSTSCAMRKAINNKIYLRTYFAKKNKKKNHREPHVL